MSVGDLCIASLTLNTPPQVNETSGPRWPTSLGLRPYSSIVMIRMCAKHFFMRRGPGSRWISKMLIGPRPLVGGSSHLQGVTCDRPIIDLLQKTCASTLMKAAMRGA
jgi:hypothetical protein